MAGVGDGWHMKNPPPLSDALRIGTAVVAGFIVISIVIGLPWWTVVMTLFVIAVVLLWLRPLLRAAGLIR